MIVLAHSYGGVPAAGAAHGLSKATRTKDGKTGGVLGLIYMCAFIVPKVASELDYIGGKHAPFVRESQVHFAHSPNCSQFSSNYVYPLFTSHSLRSNRKARLYADFDKPSEGLCTVSSPIESFYQDVDPGTANSLVGSLRPHAMLAFVSPTGNPAWAEPAFENKLAYLRCTQDQAIPAALQDNVIERSGVRWMVRDIDAGHSPWVSKPKEVVEAIIEFAEQFAA